MDGFQKSYLRGLGQTLRPAISVGKKGLDEAFFREIKGIFDRHELIKVRFAAQREEKRELSARLSEETGATLVGAIGNTALFYREHLDPEKREIALPKHGQPRSRA